MHLLAATPGTIADGTEAIDLGQTPGDIVFLSAADTELAALSAAYAAWGVGEGVSQNIGVPGQAREHGECWLRGLRKKKPPMRTSRASGFSRIRQITLTL